MPPSKFLLYLDQTVVAGALEAMRRVCQPDTKVLPHITVRYSRRELTDEALSHYANAVVDDIILVEPMSFEQSTEEPALVRTVVLLCESENLEWLSYKPDFPGSVFHLTIYDGEPSEFAGRVLEMLRQFPWNRRLLPGYSDLLPFQRPTIQPTLGPEGVALTPGAREVLKEVMELRGLRKPVPALDDEERLEVLRDLAALIQLDQNSTDAGGLTEMDDSLVRPEHVGQAAFWSKVEVSELSGQRVTPELKETASYLTPPELAIDIMRALWLARDGDLPVRFGDPAVGPGVFYAALRQISRGYAVDSAMGVEVNPVRAETTAKRWRRTGFQVIADDFLKAHAPAHGWTLLAANPPYLRSQMLPSSIGMVRDRLSKDLKLTISGRSDLYVYFVLQAHGWLADRGVAAWLLPAEFMVTDYGKALREYLSSRVRLLRIHLFGHAGGQFENARVTSVVVFYTKVPASEDDSVVFSEGSSIASPAKTRIVALKSLQGVPRWSFQVARSKSSVDEVELSRLFDIKRGIATGANEAFVLDADRMAALGWPRQFTRPVFPRSRSMQSTVVEAAINGEPIVESPRWILDSDVPLSEIRQSNPLLGSYLERLQKEFGGRTLVRQRRPIYKQERRVPPQIVFVYMAKSDAQVGRRFYLNHSMAVALNSYLGMTARPELVELLGDDLKAFVAETHRRLSRLDQSALLEAGRIYTNGLLKLEPRELGSLRVPTDGLAAEVLKYLARDS